MRSHPVEAVIFDCDGTIIDSMPAWHQLESDLAWLGGVEMTGQLADTLNANTLEETIGLFHYHYGVGKSYQQLLENAYQQLLTFYRESATLKAGVRSFIDGLRQRGIPLAVLSSSPERLVRAGLEKNDLDTAFDLVVSAQDRGESKRDPLFVASVVRQLDARPQTTWGFDDSSYALQSMRAAGMHTVGVYDSNVAGSFSELAAVADLAIRDFTQISTKAFMHNGNARQPLPCPFA